MSKSSNQNICVVYFIGGLDCVVLLISPSKQIYNLQNHKTLHTHFLESEKHIYSKKLLWFLCVFYSMRKASRRNLAFKSCLRFFKKH
jgi:hypothetical protein